jgi:8-oxo-dGTP diphosphatase
VTLVRAAVLISAPIGAVFDLTRERSTRTPPWLGAIRVVEEEPPRRLTLAAERGRWRSLRRVCRLAETGAGTLLTDELVWETPLGPLGRLADALVLRRRMLGLLVTGAAELRAIAEHGAVSAEHAAVAAEHATVSAEHAAVSAEQAAVSAEPTASPAPAAGMLVVGAALLDGAGRVLAGQRAGPPELAGRWEFPGGKVEPGESEVAALVRECQEELGVRIQLDARLGADLPVQGGGGVLRVWTGRIVAGEPVAHQHRALRWLAPDELDEVDWLPADRPLIDLLRARPGRR